MTELAIVDRVTFFNADDKTAFEVHNVPVGTDAQKYAQDWWSGNDAKDILRGRT